MTVVSQTVKVLCYEITEAKINTKFWRNWAQYFKGTNKVLILTKLKIKLRVRI